MKTEEIKKPTNGESKKDILTAPADLRPAKRSFCEIGRCFFCNLIIKWWHRSGYIYANYPEGSLKLYRGILCMEHYNAFHREPIVRKVINKKLRDTLKENLRYHSMQLVLKSKAN